ncbi:MAG: hypothetical protein DRQ88_11270 [Epsilonproteobacteria bacterium]|nr:MAG: hypothetical protein DRQ89_06625 [Campylobacterota bacterium]RLA64264.1 MAG: hypothetical protein DRQ88_11270 [Campylobacterota bacterium]
MSKIWFKGTITGAVIVFVWGFFSWMVLPWHQFKDIQNEAEVIETVRISMPEAGVYLIPSMPMTKNDAEMNSYLKKKYEGPTGILFINPAGMRPMGQVFFISLGIQLLAAFIFMYLLMKTSGLNLWQKANFVALVAIGGAIISHLPNWNLWSYPTSWTLVHIADAGISWYFAGFAMGKISES